MNNSKYEVIGVTISGIEDAAGNILAVFDPPIERKRTTFAVQSMTNPEIGFAVTVSLENYDKAKELVREGFDAWCCCSCRETTTHFSTELIRKYDVICLEDLNVSGMVKNHHLAKAISDCSWNEFVRILQYKADWYGRTISKIDRFYPSSQTCSCCGCVNPKTKDLSVREWICPDCRTTHDRDINAAKNILKQGLLAV